MNWENLKDFAHYMRTDFKEDLIEMVFEKGHKGHGRPKKEEEVKEQEDFTAEEAEMLRDYARQGFANRECKNGSDFVSIANDYPVMVSALGKLDEAIKELRKE